MSGRTAQMSVPGRYEGQQLQATMAHSIAVTAQEARAITSSVIRARLHLNPFLARAVHL